MSTPIETKATQIELTISEEHKETLEKAANMTGLSLNDYVIHQAVSAAMEHIASYDKMLRSRSRHLHRSTRKSA